MWIICSLYWQLTVFEWHFTIFTRFSKIGLQKSFTVPGKFRVDKLKPVCHSDERQSGEDS